jgi:Cu(I)/Ag(I) efflux system membrane protein CusA/SilA
MLTIPLASIGGLAAVWWTGGDLSIASLIGFITLCGISSRNAILMLSHFLHLLKEGMSFSQELVLRGAQERLLPVLMTSITAILGLIPLAMSGGEPGREILYPLSTVIIGGLISSTFFDILITPTVFYLFGRKAALTALEEKEYL